MGFNSGFKGLMATRDWIHEVRTSFNFLYIPVTFIKYIRQWMQQAVGCTSKDISTTTRDELT